MMFSCGKDIDINKIHYIHELREVCSVFGYEIIAKKYDEPVFRIIKLCNSEVAGSEPVSKYTKIRIWEFEQLLKKAKGEKIEFFEWLENKVPVYYQDFVRDLKVKRNHFAGIGTNGAKKRLNHAGKVNPVARAIKLSMEVEERVIMATGYHGRNPKVHWRIAKRVSELVKLSQENNWVYGIEDSDLEGMSHKIYFQIPNCDQVSWYFSPDNVENIAAYKGKWMQKRKGTLSILEEAYKNLRGPNNSL